MKYFKLVHAPTWKIPYYMKGILSICTRQETFGTFNNFPLSATLLCLERYIFFGNRWFLMKYFKLVHAPTWKIPYYMTGFLSICTRQEAFGIFNNFPLSATLLCLVRYIFFGKRLIFMKYFKLVHAPTWKIPTYMKFFYSFVQDIESSVSSTFLCYLRLPTALQGTSFWKKTIFSWNISSWCMPQLGRFLIIWQVFYPYVQGMKHSVSLIVFALSATPLCLVRYIFLEKDDFSWNISSWSMPQLERFLNIWKDFYPYVQGMKRSVSLIVLRYLRLSDALNGTFFGKIWFFSCNISRWCMPQLERFLNIWIFFFYSYVQDIEFGTFNFFALSATP